MRQKQSESEIVFVFAVGVLRYPEDDGREHKGYVLRDVGVAVVGILLGVGGDYIFQDQDGLHAPQGENSWLSTDETQNRGLGPLTALPASPPAINANPMNKNRRALHTALESPNPSSPLILSLSMRLTTRKPKREQIPGIQSTKVTWTGGGICGSPGGE